MKKLFIICMSLILSLIVLNCDDDKDCKNQLPAFQTISVDQEYKNQTSVPNEYSIYAFTIVNAGNYTISITEQEVPCYWELTIDQGTCLDDYSENDLLAFSEFIPEDNDYRKIYLPAGKYVIAITSIKTIAGTFSLQISSEQS